MKYKFLTVILIGLFITGSSVSQSGDDLFSLRYDDSNLAPNQKERLENLRKDSIAETVTQIVFSDPIATLLRHDFTINLGQAGVLKAQTRGVSRLGKSALRWLGHIGESEAFVSLHVDNGVVQGRFRARSRDWLIEPIGGSGHALTLLREGQMVEGEMYDDVDLSSGPGSLMGTGKRDKNVRESAAGYDPTYNVIDIMVVFSDDAADIAGNITTRAST